MRIDTHQHFWRYDPQRHSWIDESKGRIRRDFLPADLQPILKANHIDGCISIEANQSEDETHFLLDLAEKYEFIKGVIGWVNLLDKNVQERLVRFSSFDKFKGVRHLVQAEKDINFMLRDDFQNGLSVLKDFDLIYEILIFPPHLPAAISCVRNHPQQKFVLNHIAKPYIKDQKMEPWLGHIKELAAQSNVYCKLSGLVTEADMQNWKERDFDLYMDAVINAFGTSRIMFGSDWPVCLLAAEYRQVVAIVENYISSFIPEQRDRIMGINAREFYGLK